jgi:hypothetical protein
MRSRPAIFCAAFGFKMSLARSRTIRDDQQGKNPAKRRVFSL